MNRKEFLKKSGSACLIRIRYQRRRKDLDRLISTFFFVYPASTLLLFLLFRKPDKTRVLTGQRVYPITIPYISYQYGMMTF